MPIEILGGSANPEISETLQGFLSMYQQKRLRIFAAETIAHMSLIHFSMIGSWTGQIRVGFAIAFPHEHNKGHNRNGPFFPGQCGLLSRRVQTWNKHATVTHDSDRRSTNRGFASTRNRVAIGRIRTMLRRSKAGLLGHILGPFRAPGGPKITPWRQKTLNTHY